MTRQTTSRWIWGKISLAHFVIINAPLELKATGNLFDDPFAWWCYVLLPRLECSIKMQKNICPLLWGKALICDTYTFLHYYIYYIILHLDSTLFFSFGMRVSNSRLCLPFSYFRHLMPRSSSRKRFPSQSNPHCAGHRNCTLLPATSKGLWLALKSVRNMIMNCDYVVTSCTKWSIMLAKRSKISAIL